MISTNRFKNLKTRTEEILKMIPENEDKLLNKNIGELISEITNYQTSIELENENLRNKKLHLEQLQSQFSDLFYLAPLGYLIIDKNGLITNSNEAAAKLLGVEIKTLINKSFSRYIAPESQYTFSEYQQRALKQIILGSCQLKVLQKNKPIVYAQIEGKTYVNPSTGNTDLLVMLINLAKYKQESSEQSFSNSLTELSTSVVSEINQPLSIIANYIHGCIQRLESGTYQTNNLLHAMKQAAQQLHRTSELILRMKNFGSKDLLTREYTCLDSLVKETINLIKHELIEYPVEILYRPTSTLPQIKIDKIYIQQVILNLSRNAIEAMRDANSNDPKLIIEINRSNKNNIEISIIDTGPGFPLKTAHKLFDPHFTTKSYGIGLGLVVCRTIVRSHGGELDVELNATCGACFKFTLPIVDLS